MAAGPGIRAAAFLPPPGDAPGPVDGGPGPDRFIRGLTVFTDRYVSMLADRRAGPGNARPRQPGPVVPRWRTMVVTGRARECEEVISLRLAAPGGGTPQPWYPGAHVQIELPSGKIRHYSLNGDPADRTAYRIAVRLITDGGGGSAEVHDVLAPGTELRVAGPFNAFPFAAEPAVLFVAGGIGITPVLPMARKAAVLGLDWRLVYAGRSRVTMPFLAEADGLDGAAAGQDAARRVDILADDETGAPDPADLIRRAPPGAAAYVCGPPQLLAGVRDAADTAVSAGLLRGLHFERFTAPPIVDGRPFEVKLNRSGTVLPVAADQSLLSVLRAHDPATPYSCKQGFCGTCKQRVLSGEVEHRDQHLTGSERTAGEMLVCVSRARAGERLVLDR